MNLSDNLDAAELTARVKQDPRNAKLALSALKALLPVASQRGVDEPQLDATAATAMVSIARAALAPLAMDRAAQPGASLWSALSQGLRLLDPGNTGEAVVAAERAVSLDASDAAAWRELGIARKWHGEWAQAADAYQRAHALLPTDKRLALDAALCATAAGKGSLAVELFRSMGLPATLALGGMPSLNNLPEAEIRVATKLVVGPSARPDAAARFEVLRVAPLSPCHGVVLSPTFGDGLVDAGDVVLWDSAPASVREDATTGAAIPCFALLARLQAGDEKRFRFIAIEDKAGQLEKLSDILPSGVSLVQQLVHSVEGERRVVYGKAIIPASCDLHGLRHAYEAAQKNVQAVYVAMPALYEALGDTPMAGKAHQAWGGIERTAQKRAGG